MSFVTTRLITISKMIIDEKIVVDCGTDHAYLPIYLAKQNKVDKIFAVDISNEAIKFAEQNINNFGVQNKVVAFQANGISWINEYKQNIDVCVIAGIGSLTILNILKNDSNLIDSYIIASNTNCDAIRLWIKDHKYFVEDEKIIKENNIIYEIFKINKYAGKKIKNKNDIIFGPIIRRTYNDIFFEKWLFEENRCKNLLNKIPKDHINYKKILTRYKLIKKANNKYIKKYAYDRKKGSN